MDDELLTQVFSDILSYEMNFEALNEEMSTVSLENVECTSTSSEGWQKILKPSQRKNENSIMYIISKND